MKFYVINTLTDRQARRQAGRKTGDRQTDKTGGRQINRQAMRVTDRLTNRHIDRPRRQIYWQDRQAGRYPGRQANWKTDTPIYRLTGS